MIYYFLTKIASLKYSSIFLITLLWNTDSIENWRFLILTIWCKQDWHLVMHWEYEKNYTRLVFCQHLHFLHKNPVVLLSLPPISFEQSEVSCTYKINCPNWPIRYWKNNFENQMRPRFSFRLSLSHTCTYTCLIQHMI